MLKLYVKDNMNGCVHEYGTNCHDALILQEDGSLHYENLQIMCGTMFPEEGYSFCFKDGTIPRYDVEHGVEPYIDIGGEYYTKPKTKADRIRAMSDEELAVMFADHENKVAFEVCCSFGLPSVDYDFEESTSELLEWLKQPAEGE